MLSINTFLPTSAIETLPPWITCHCPGVAISRVSVGCGLFPSDCIPVSDGDFDVPSDLLSETCQCASWRVIGPRGGAYVSSPQTGNRLHYLQTTQLT